MSFDRVRKLFARDGIYLERDGDVYYIKSDNHPTIRILLPDELPLEKKAVDQLVNFASVKHPNGGSVLEACATPDFHPGDVVPIGSVITTSEDIVIPQATGQDINCGMRLHIMDLTLDRFISGKKELTTLLKGDLLLGTRDFPMTLSAMSNMFEWGVEAWLDDIRSSKGMLGTLAKSNLDQIAQELSKIYRRGSEIGDTKYAPEDLLPENRKYIRDGSLATLGGGNHFAEFQVVDEVFDNSIAYQWGIKPGQITFMLHTGSRAVGNHIGKRWSEIAREQWPKDKKYPSSGIFPLHGEAVSNYLTAMHTAANYAYVNRLLLAELIRIRVRELFGDVEAPLIYDLPHNVVFQENNMYVHRKGATPAHMNQPVLIPGSMGDRSYLMIGLANQDYVSSCSHGAGRSKTRFEMGRKGSSHEHNEARCFECITLNEDRIIEERPDAYKPIGPVIEAQVKAGLIAPVASLKPIMTYKG